MVCSQVCWCRLTGLTPLHLFVWHIWTVGNAPAEVKDHQQVPQAGQQTELRLLRITGHLTRQYHQMSLPASSQPRFHNEVCQHLTAYSSQHRSLVYRGRALEEAAEGREAASNKISPRMLKLAFCELNKLCKNSKPGKHNFFLCARSAKRLKPQL